MPFPNLLRAFKIFSNFNDLHHTRQAAAEWRRVELQLQAVNQFEWEEDLVRNVLLVGLLDNDAEQHLYAGYLDRYNFHQQQSFVQVLGPQQPLTDSDETESEDDTATLPLLDPRRPRARATKNQRALTRLLLRFQLRLLLRLLLRHLPRLLPNICPDTCPDTCSDTYSDTCSDGCLAQARSSR